MTNTPADERVTLPTRRMLLAATVACLLAGGAWAVAMLATGRGATAAITGFAAAAAVLVGAVTALTAIRPWRPRTLAEWPMVWIGGSFLRLVVTIAVAFLLYSATPYSGRLLWFAVVVAYLATLVGETRVYAMSMRRFAPTTPVRSSPTSTSSDSSTSE